MNISNDVIQYLNQLGEQQKPIVELYIHAALERFPSGHVEIKYGIPTLVDIKNLLHISGNHYHVGIYPGPILVGWLKSLDNKIETSKGTWRIGYETQHPHPLFSQLLDQLKGL
jgi:uncharacterized protein YdhG (YjbR/CyaY superfamily)